MMNPFKSRAKAQADAVERAKEREQQRIREIERELARERELEWQREVQRQVERERELQRMDEMEREKARLIAKEPDAQSNFTTDSVPEQSPMRTLGFGRKKKRPEPRREIAFVDVLPPADNFRTSLLLPNLSARFSMLRALDENALCEQPRRTPLRMYQQQDNDYLSPGSIMERAKPRKGNKLFGGRQKVYVAGASGEHPSDRNRFGRQFYEEDVQSSGFFKRGEQDQHLPVRRERRPLTPLEADRYIQQLSEASVPASPSAASDTSQSGADENTRLGPGFGRPSPERIPGKRLYEQSLDRHMLKHQTSVVDRLESNHLNGIFAPGSLSESKTTSNSSDRVGLGPSMPSLAANGASNTCSSPTTVDPMADFAIDPRDLGKATASGVFQRPRTPYNEKQFAQRQRKLQEGKSSPQDQSPRTSESAGDSGPNSPGSEMQFQLPLPSQYAGMSPVGVVGAGWRDEARSEAVGHPSIFEPQPQDAGPKLMISPQEFDHRRCSYDPFRAAAVFSGPLSSGTPPEPRLQGGSAANMSTLGTPMSLEADGDLGDLVRKHLRSKSNASSIYPASLAGEEPAPMIPNRTRPLAFPMCG